MSESLLKELSHKELEYGLKLIRKEIRKLEQKAEEYGLDTSDEMTLLLQKHSEREFCKCVLKIVR